MLNELLERMVKEAGIHNVGTCEDCGLTMYQLRKLAEIVRAAERAAEREACAVVAEQGEWKLTKIGKTIAAAIRRRPNESELTGAPLLARPVE